MYSITLQLLLLIAFGLVQLFFGYPLFRILVVLAGAVVGFSYGPLLLTNLTARPVEPWMGFSVAILAAIILGLLAWLAFWVVVFLWGAVIGYGAVEPVTVGVLLPLLAGVGVGVLAVLFQRFLIVGLTALSGAWLTATAGAVLLGLLPPSAVPPGGIPIGGVQPMLLAVILALAVVGVIVQFRRAVPASRF